MQTTSHSNPLDTLVIAQLASLRRQEAELSNQIGRRDLTAEIVQLRDRAERLNRMLDAMQLGQIEVGTPLIPAVA